MSGGRTKTEKRNMKISEARPLLEEAESDRLINQDTVSSLASSAAVLHFDSIRVARVSIITSCTCHCADLLYH